MPSPFSSSSGRPASRPRSHPTRIIGEKQEQSLEPLLATPTTDSEILLGKSIGALLPPLVAIWIGAVIFMGLIDAITFGLLGYLYYPNAVMAVIMLLLVPLAAVTAVEVSVIVSARVNDVRTAQQLGSLIVIPFAIDLCPRRDKRVPAYGAVSPPHLGNYPGRRYRALLFCCVHIPEGGDPHKVEMKMFKRMRETARDLLSGTWEETKNDIRHSTFKMYGSMGFDNREKYNSLRNGKESPGPSCSFIGWHIWWW